MTDVALDLDVLKAMAPESRAKMMEALRQLKTAEELPVLLKKAEQTQSEIITLRTQIGGSSHPDQVAFKEAKTQANKKRQELREFREKHKEDATMVHLAELEESIKENGTKRTKLEEERKSAGIEKPLFPRAKKSKSGTETGDGEDDEDVEAEDN
jgi:hypothetical protein